MVNTVKLISLFSTRPLFKARLSYWKEGSWVAILLFSLPLQAQVITDGTVGDAVTLSGQDVTIPQDLGALQGNNLFHSFQTFNIQSNGSATFTGANSINNVISRVTGGEISNIDGTLRSEMGQANFFFLNPAGVIFGAGAQVDVPASFHVSTADELRFADGAVYSATNPNTSTLTLATPEAFGFLGQNQSSITMDQARLEFQKNTIVSIVSSDIAIRDGRLFVANGGLRIIAQGDNASNVSISDNIPTSATGSLEIVNGYISNDSDIYNPDEGDTAKIFIHAGDMLFTDRSDVIDWSDEGVSSSGTAIEVIVNDFAMLNGSSFFSDSFGGTTGGDIRVIARRFMIDGQDSDAFSFRTGIVSEAEGAPAATIKVNADELTIVNGGKIGAGYTEGGVGGLVTVVAGALLIDGQNSKFFTGISSETEVAGAGGTTKLTAQELTIVNGGEINGSSSAEGNAGSVIVDAERILIDRQKSERFTGISSEARGAGDGGTIAVTANELTIVNGGEISGRSLGDGDAGSVTVNARRLLIDVRNSEFSTGITSTSKLTDAGPVAVKAGYVALLGGQITTSTDLAGKNGGHIEVLSDVLVMKSGFIQANAVSGQGGNIEIDADAVVASSNAVLVGGVERMNFQNDGPNVMQAVAPDGVNGIVNINAPDIDISGSLLALDPSFVDITGLAFDPCAAFVSGAPSTFTVLGRGGLPSSSNGNMSFSLAGELLDQLLADVNADSHLPTIDRVHSTKLSFTINAMTGLPIVSLHGPAIACS